MHQKSALTPENIERSEAVAEFCHRYSISLSTLAGMTNGVRFSRTEAHRLVNCKSFNVTVDRVFPALYKAFGEYLATTRNMTDTEIEAELASLFDPEETTKMIANRCPLSPDAIRHFRLNRDPFDVDHLPQRDELYTNDAIESVVGRLKDAVLYQRFVAVIGGVGTGKTLLKLRVADELDGLSEPGAIATGYSSKTKLLYPEFFDMEEVTVHGIANKILAELGQKIPQNKEARVTRIREVLTQMQQEGIGVAIILDECHRLRDKVISSLKNFWEMTNGRSSRLLGVILFGQPSFVDSRLRDVKFKEIRQRVQIIEMPAMNGSSRDYIAHRLRLAGGDIDTLFEAKAIERIAINAHTPLALGNLTNEALMEAYRLEEPQVSASFEMFKKLSTGQQVLGMRRSA